MEYEKLIRDGNVAVIYSPGFGAGWSTWIHERESEAVFDKDLALAILGESDETPLQVVERKGYKGYTGKEKEALGLRDVAVAWVPEGQRFEIHEYDGSEGIRMLRPEDGYVA